MTWVRAVSGTVLAAAAGVLVGAALRVSTATSPPPVSGRGRAEGSVAPPQECVRDVERSIAEARARCLLGVELEGHATPATWGAFDEEAARERAGSTLRSVVEACPDEVRVGWVDCAEPPCLCVVETVEPALWGTCVVDHVRVAFAPGRFDRVVFPCDLGTHPSPDERGLRRWYSRRHTLARAEAPGDAVTPPAAGAPR